MKKWYAVQETSEDPWDYGTYDYNEAVEILKNQGCGLIAVITEDEDEKTCTEELRFEDLF